jgi:predicted DNA-binding protein
MTVPESNRKAIRKYDAEHYAMLSVRIPKELLREFKEKCTITGDSQAKIIKEAIEAYLAS